MDYLSYRGVPLVPILPDFRVGLQSLMCQLGLVKSSWLYLVGRLNIWPVLVL